MARVRRRRCQAFSAVLIATGVANACHFGCAAASATSPAIACVASSVQQTVDDLEPEQVVQVATPEEFVKSVENKDLDIVITNHIDLRYQPHKDGSLICKTGCDNALGVVTARSIRGNCSADKLTPTGITLTNEINRNRGQCLVVTETDLFHLGDRAVWLDNLFLKIAFRSTTGDRSSKWPNLISVPPADTKQGERYVTRVTLEGDGVGPAGGLWADSDILIQGSIFSQLGGSGSVCPECKSALIAKTSRITVNDCDFEDPLDVPGALHILATDGGNVLLLNSNLQSTKNDVRIVKRNASEVFGDSPTQWVNDSNAARNDTRRPVEIRSINQNPPDGERFLRMTDCWLNFVKAILVEGHVPQPKDDGRSSGGSDSPAGIIAGVVCAALVLTLALAALLLLRRRRQRSSRQYPGAAKHPEAGPYTAPGMPGGHLPAPHSQHSSHSATHTGPDGSMRSNLSSPFPFHATGGSSVPSMNNSMHSSAAGGYPSKPFTSMYVKSGTHDATTITETFDSAAPTSGPPPSVDAPLSSKLDYLHSQLSQFGKSDVLLGRFTLLGETQRRQGGQGVVAFAVGVDDRLEYAIKFFVVHSSYIAERQLYETKLLGALLPKIEDVYDPAMSPSRLLDRFGRKLPPCIVMERGESLNEWSRRAKPDVFQSVAVMAHVATRLRDMHKAGWVHRDIKPSNIMLLPRENRWTVIDFGSAAEVGIVAPLSYTLVYAAPEVAEAGATGVKTIVADPAIDAWALGVVAFELLTGKSTFDMLHDGKASVVAQLRGQQELPWEGERLRSHPAVRKRLGVFKNPVLALLHRDPVRRASMEDFCGACNSLFSGPTTVQEA